MHELEGFEAVLSIANADRQWSTHLTIDVTRILNKLWEAVDNRTSSPKATRESRLRSNFTSALEDLIDAWGKPSVYNPSVRSARFKFRATERSSDELQEAMTTLDGYFRGIGLSESTDREVRVAALREVLQSLKDASA